MKRILFFTALLAAISFNAYAYDFSAVAPSGQTLYYNIVDGHAEVVRPGTGSTYNNYVAGDLIIPDTVIYNGNTYAVTVLATIYVYGTFEGCSGLTSVTIPNSVTSIGEYAFYNCSGLTSVTIPNSVTSIGSSAFSNVRHIEYYGSASGSPWGAISMNGIMEGDFVFSDSTKHYLAAYLGIDSSVTIPSSVVTIGDKAFYDCSSLTAVTIPNSVTSIGNSAFEGCSGLTSVTIPNSVTSIGDGAFRNCISLTAVTIPNSVTSIGDGAFRNCSGLTSVTIPNSVTSIGNSAFEDCSGLTSVTIGNSVTSIGNYAFAYCSSLTSVTIGSGVTSIGNAAFYACSGLTSVTIGSGVTSIGSYAFYNCSGLTVMWMKPTIPPTLYNATSLGADSVPLIVPYNSYNTYINAGTYYTNHPIYRDSIIVTSLVNDTLRGYVTGGDTILVYPYDNDTVTLTATAIAYYGYHFVRWDDYSTDNPRHIVTNSGITRTAIFDFNKYTITLQTDTSIHGSCNGGGNYNYLSERTIQTNASYGYHFTHWQDGSTDNPRTVLLTQDTSFIAYYDRNTYTLTFQSADTNKGIVNTVSVTGEYLDTTILIDAIAIPHYHFVRWNDNSTENPRRFVIDDNRTYTAYFSIDVHNVSVQIGNIAHGTVDGSGSREYGQPITVSATPFSGYQFTHWSNGSTYNPYTFAVLQDSSLTAFFVADGEPWQDTVVLYDTINVDVHDTTYIPYAVHDTTYIDVHDTTYINVHDTTYIPYAVHDTTYIDVHDTTYIDMPYPVHDTTYVDVPYPVHDTTIVHDTTYVDVPYPVHDTTYIDVPYPVHDTTVVIDTIWLMQYDTVWLHDTIVVHDTIYITMEGVDGAEAVNAKVYASQGQIVVEGAESNTVTLYDVRGRILATRRDDGAPLRFDAPASGTYMIKIGSHAARKVVVIR